ASLYPSLMRQYQLGPARDFDPDEAVSVGALVTVQEEAERRRFLIAPQGGGLELPVSALGAVTAAEPAGRGAVVTVLTLTSPMGRALVGKHVGDECELTSGAGVRTLEIVSLQ
ncbi:MAG TPA: GreA/GreB family elongation factor, partial [Kofleriaceae bacterium]|nr:GreA/GreB family elongation factor [Kofleriaceae bacterium]